MMHDDTAAITGERTYAEYLEARAQIGTDAGFDPVWLPDWYEAVGLFDDLDTSLQGARAEAVPA